MYSSFTFDGAPTLDAHIRLENNRVSGEPCSYRDCLFRTQMSTFKDITIPIPLLKSSLHSSTCLLYGMLKNYCDRYYFCSLSDSRLCLLMNTSAASLQKRLKSLRDVHLIASFNYIYANTQFRFIVMHHTIDEVLLSFRKAQLKVPNSLFSAKENLNKIDRETFPLHYFTV